jgi:hypothetical protein
MKFPLCKKATYRVEMLVVVKLHRSCKYKVCRKNPILTISSPMGKMIFENPINPFENICKYNGHTQVQIVKIGFANIIQYTHARARLRILRGIYPRQWQAREPCSRREAGAA